MGQPGRYIGLHVIDDLAIYNVYVDPKWTIQEFTKAVLKASHELRASVLETLALQMITLCRKIEPDETRARLNRRDVIVR